MSRRHRARSAAYRERRTIRKLAKFDLRGAVLETIGDPPEARGLTVVDRIVEQEIGALRAAGALPKILWNHDPSAALTDEELHDLMESDTHKGRR